MNMNNNFIIRTITGLTFVVIVAGCILWHPISYGILFAIFSGATTWEFCSLMNKYQGCQINRMITTVASVYLFGAIMAFNANITGSEIFIPYLITLVYLLIVELYFPKNNVLMNWAFTMMSQLYIALPFALLNTLSFISVNGLAFSKKCRFGISNRLINTKDSLQVIIKDLYYRDTFGKKKAFLLKTAKK